MAEQRNQKNNAPVNTPPAPQQPETGRMHVRQDVLRWLLCLSLFLVVAGVRWWTVGTYGSDLPYWDQWDQAANLFKPYHDGTLSPDNWIRPHNEHRIFFTRLLALLLFVANGQWDARLEAMINACIYAFVICGLFILFSRQQSIRSSMLTAGWLAVVSILPYAWENTLNGFQSQFYFLAAFSLASFYLLLNSKPGSMRWIGGALICFAGLFTMSSGLLAPAAVLGVLTLLALRDTSRWRDSLKEAGATALVSAVTLAAGLFFMVRVESLAGLQAQSIGEFVQVLTACFAWPNRSMLLAILTWLPYMVFLILLLSRRIADGPRERFLLAMGLWVMLQAAAMSYARAHAGIQSRYTDVLAFGLTTNFLCALLLAGLKQKFSKFMAVVLIFWAAVNGTSLYQASFNNSVTFRKLMYENERIHTAGYVATGNMNFLTPSTSRTELDVPFHDSKKLAALLQDPALRTKLPVGIQKSLPLVPEQDSPEPAYIEKSTPRQIRTAEDITEQTGVFSRFAVVKPVNGFRYHMEKEGMQPFLYLYFRGEADDFSLIDSQGGVHKVIGLPSNEREWQYGVVSCPTRTATLAGTAASSGFTLMEPKEIGTLSIAAIVIGREGLYLAGTGAALFAVLGMTALFSAAPPVALAAKQKRRRS